MTLYQPLIAAVVNSFVRKGFFTYADKMDVVQTVNTQLLEKKIGRIREHFNGSVYLRTYFSKVVYNICLEMTRRKKRQPIVGGDDLLQFETEKSLDPEQKLAIKDELLRLEALLKGLRKKRLKTVICLKLYARKWLTEADLDGYNEGLWIDELAMYRATFFDHYEKMNDKDVYAIAVLLFNKAENKTNSTDSLRKWVTSIVDQFVSRLNGDPPAYGYNRETLRILMQMYFSDNG